MAYNQLIDLRNDVVQSPHSSTARYALKEFIKSNVEQLCENELDWLSELFHPDVLNVLPITDLELPFTRSHLPLATLLSSIQNAIFLTANHDEVQKYLKFLHSLFDAEIILPHMAYNAIWRMIKSAKNIDNAESFLAESTTTTATTTEVLDKEPEPLDDTDFPPQYEWFRFYLSKYFTINPALETTDLLEIVEESMSLSPGNRSKLTPPLVYYFSSLSRMPKRRQIIKAFKRLMATRPPPFSVESCFKHNLMNSYEEYQYYRQPHLSTNPPLHIAFPDYSSIPHPFFTILPNAMSDAEIVQTADYQCYFIGMFLLGHPLQPIITKDLELQTPDSSQFLLNTPIYALRALMSDDRYSGVRSWMFQHSIAFKYQCHILNFRFHFLRSVITPPEINPPESQFLVLTYSSSATDFGCTLIDPLLYWTLSNHTTSSTSKSHIPRNTGDDSTPIQASDDQHISPYELFSSNHLYSPNLFEHFLRAMLPSGTQAFTILLNFLSNSASHYAAVNLTTLNNTPTPPLSPTTHNNNPLLNPITPFPPNLNLVANATTFTTMLNQFFTHIESEAQQSAGLSSSTSLLDVHSCQPKFSQAYLRAFILHSYHQLRNGVPTLYQHIYSVLQHARCTCLLTFLLFSPLFAFRTNFTKSDEVDQLIYDDIAGEADAAECDSLQIVQTHITLLCHASFLNPTISSTSLTPLDRILVPRDEERAHQHTFTQNNCDRFLIPLRAAIYSWLMIHTGFTRVFPSASHNSSHSNIFYHIMTTLNNSCPLDYHHGRTKEDEYNMQILKPFVPWNINIPIRNPLYSNENSKLIHDLQKLVIDNHGNMIFVQPCPTQSTFSESILLNFNANTDENANSTLLETIWDEGVSVIDFTSPFCRLPNSVWYTGVYPHSYQQRRATKPTEESFDFTRYRNHFKLSTARQHCSNMSDSNEADEPVTDLVDELLTDEILFKLATKDQTVVVPAPFHQCFVEKRYMKDCEPFLKLEYDYTNPYELTAHQSQAVSSALNQYLISSPQMIALQREYKAHLKELLAYESRVVVDILKNVVSKAGDAGLFQTNPVKDTKEESVFRSYPFPPLCRAPPTRCELRQHPDDDLSSSQRWCIEMLLVATLHIQPAYSPKLHTHIIISQSHNTQQLQKNTTTATATATATILRPDRNWLSTLPYVAYIPKLYYYRDEGDIPFFMCDALLQVVLQPVLTAHSILFSLCEEDESR